MEVYFGTVLVRALHVLFGILWIGLLYYFNFVQTEYFKDADADAKSDVVQKLVPNALWYFRWAAAFTFLTGLYLLYYLNAWLLHYFITSVLRYFTASLLHFCFASYFHYRVTLLLHCFFTSLLHAFVT